MPAMISSDILASYAGDAAREVEGVEDLVEGTLPRHKGVRILEEDDQVRVEVRLRVAWGACIPEVGKEVQRRVAAYLARMASVTPLSIDVTVEEIGPR